MNITLTNKQPFTSPGGSLDLDIKPITLITGDNGTFIDKFLCDIGECCHANVIGITDYVKLYSSTNWCYGAHWKDVVKVPTPTWNDTPTLMGFESAVKEWFKFFDFKSVTYDTANSYKGLELEGVPLSQLDVGTNCIAKIIVDSLGALCETNTEQPLVLVFNNPENYLSPTNQVKLTEFIIALSYVNNIHVVINTQSDHVLNSVVYRVMCSYKTNKDLFDSYKILYLTKDDSGNIKCCDNILIDSHIGLKDCPNGFFTMYGDIVRTILDRGYKNILVDNNDNDK